MTASRAGGGSDAILAEDGYNSVAPHSIHLQTTAETGLAHSAIAQTPNK